jgi:H+/Cl- antiporter ClcA
VSIQRIILLALSFTLGAVSVVLGYWLDGFNFQRGDTLAEMYITALFAGGACSFLVGAWPWGISK